MVVSGLLQRYSLETRNGVKVAILPEELLALGREEAEYDAWLINIGDVAGFNYGELDVGVVIGSDTAGITGPRCCVVGLSLGPSIKFASFVMEIYLFDVLPGQSKCWGKGFYTLIIFP